MLNLQKIEIENYERKENGKPVYDNLKQNISRSWAFLKKTHNLKNGECLCIRALPTKTNEFDEWCFPQELIIFNYKYDSYKEYENFMISKVNSKRIYNFYYNIYNINIRRAKETCKENEGGFFGKSCNVGSTSILVCDFDDFTQDDYLRMKQDFTARGLGETIDNMTGHGYHIIFRLDKNYDDEYLLLKFIKVLQENGYNPDVQCQDCARIMRIPFFYNQKPKKYDTVTMSEITAGEYDYKVFTVEEIFQKFGFDYNTFNLDQYYKKRREKRKQQQQQKINTEIEYQDSDINIKELYKNFNIKIDELPLGIKNMLKGFIKGYSNLQLFTLTIFFKRKGLSLDEIINILETVESINGNNWNTWNTEDEVERIYNDYSYMNKYTLMDLEDVFGDIKFSYDEEMYKIPVNVMKPTELKIYTYLLLNKNSKKKDIIKNIEIANNTVDKVVKESNFVTVQDRIYNINSDAEYKNFIYVNKEFISKLLGFTSNELSVFCYLYYRIGFKKQIRTSIQSIKKNCFVSEKTISNTIKELETHEVVKVYRDKYNYKTDSRESNLYQIL